MALQHYLTNIFIIIIINKITYISFKLSKNYKIYGYIIKVLYFLIGIQYYCIMFSLNNYNINNNITVDIILGIYIFVIL